MLNALQHRGEVNGRIYGIRHAMQIVLNALRHRGEVNDHSIEDPEASGEVLNALRHRGEVNAHQASAWRARPQCSTPYGIEAR